MCINRFECLFEKIEAYFSKVVFFHELAEDGEIALAQPRSVPLSSWENLEEQNQRVMRSFYKLSSSGFEAIENQLRSLSRRRNSMRKSSWKMVG